MRVKFGNPVSDIWGYFFLRNCRRALQGMSPNTEKLVARIRDDAQQVFDAKVRVLPDPQTRVIYAYCSLVLAAFREVRNETGDAASAYNLTRNVFQQTLERPLGLMIRLWLWFVRDPVSFLNRISIARFFQRNQGPSMEFAEEKANDYVDLVVRRCAFNQFFVDHGEPTLTPVVCALDHFWMDIIDRSSRPIRTERPSTISTGGDCCRFRFIRDNEKGEVETADIILVQLEKAPYAVQKNQSI